MQQRFDDVISNIEEDPDVIDVPPPLSSETRLTVVFTKDVWSPVSWFIRWCLPRSRFCLALSSHCLIYVKDEKGDDVYDVHFKHGVQRVNREKALKRRKIVRIVNYSLPDLAAALAFAESQLGHDYDLKGALGLGISPDRDWSDDEDWFCYEFLAAVLKAGGRDVFDRLQHITEVPLLALKA